ncbi:MAG: PleD family two-component system response regulator, partial [Myxococcales bacterium]
MSKKIFLIESDTAFSKKLRAEFEGKGFTVADTGDGKTAVEAARREKPDLVVLSVELAAGQSGYIVCGKLKKDDELKQIPVIIVGKDAEGFESHKRLKTRAEEYLKKPFEPSAILEKIGALIGLPEEEQAADVLLEEDESLGLGSLDDEPLTAAPERETREDPDLDLLDAAFEGMSDDKTSVVSTKDLDLPASKSLEEDEELTALEPVAEEPVEAPPDEGLLSDEPSPTDLALDALGSPEEDADAAFDALTTADDDKPVEEEVAFDALEP